MHAHTQVYVVIRTCCSSRTWATFGIEDRVCLSPMPFNNLLADMASGAADTRCWHLIAGVGFCTQRVSHIALLAKA